MASTPLLPPPPSAFNFFSVISATHRIIGAHSRHFLALSVLFVLPLSFSLTVFPTLHHLILSHYAPLNTNHVESLLRSALNESAQTQSVAPAAVIVTIGYILLVSLFYLFATSSITYSVIHGFYGRPVKLIYAIKSIGTSFFPLLLTSLCSLGIFSQIGLILGLFFYLVTKAIELVRHQIDYSSPYIIAFEALILFIFVLIGMHLQVKWILTNVIVVAESVWGLYALRRSDVLVKRMRRVALSLILFFGSCVTILLWACSGSSILKSVNSVSVWKNWTYVLAIVAASSLLTILMLLSLAAMVVMYMYCRAMHGELAMEIAEEFARDYVSLPFDDGKVPHVVSVAYN